MKKKGDKFHLFENAITSIQVGIEDYESKDRQRSISAIRNFYARFYLIFLKLEY